MPHLSDYQIDLVKNSWVEVDTDDNSISQAVRAAAPGRRHVITKVDASYDTDTTSGELTVLFGAVIVARKFIHGAGAIDFGVYGLQNPDVNEIVQADLAASGTGGIVGDVALTGYTTGP